MSNQHWKSYRLEDIGEIVTGKTPSTQEPGNFGNEVPFVTPSDMNGRKYIAQTERYLSQKGFNAVKGSKIPAGAVMVSCIGSDMGKVAITCQDSVTNQQINSVIAPDKTTQEFLYYALLPRKKELLNLAGGGSAQPILNKGHFSMVKLTMPEPAIRLEIVGILKSLDDKIELNRRMNETLEAMARAIFKKCFVDKIKEVANGWREGKIGDILRLSRDSIDPREFPEETFDHYSIPAFDDGSFPKREIGGQIQSNKFIVFKGSVLLSKLNPRIPRIWMPKVTEATRSISSTEFLVAISNPGFTREYVYDLFRSESFLDKFGTLVTGTSGSHQRVKPEFLLAMDIDIPPRGYVEGYTKLVKSLHERIALNLDESHNLAAIRDTLLSKLMSGDIQIE